MIPNTTSTSPMCSPPTAAEILAIDALLCRVMTFPLLRAGDFKDDAAYAKVRSRDGGDVSGARAVVRTLALPLSFLALGLGLLVILVQRERRALHDLVAGTVVLYAWDARAARLRFLARSEPVTPPSSAA